MRFFDAFEVGAFTDMLAELTRDYPGERLDRLTDFFAWLEGTRPLATAPLQAPNDLFFPGLGADPWIDAGASETTRRVTALFERNLEALRREFAANAEDGAFSMVRYSSTDRFAGLGAEEWTSSRIWQRGAFEPMADRFPLLRSVLVELEPILFPWRGEVAFMRLAPGSRLPPHHDWTNVQITCHVAIDAPPDCGIRVGSESKQWCDHPVLFFDHSFEHEVWNRSDRARVILLLNMVHPALTALEQQVLGEIFAPAKP